jgi:hypothetical protein
MYLFTYYGLVRLWSHREQNGPDHILLESHWQSFKVSTRIKLLLSISVITTQLDHNLHTHMMLLIPFSDWQAGWKETILFPLDLCQLDYNLVPSETSALWPHKLKRWFDFNWPVRYDTAVPIFIVMTALVGLEHKSRFECVFCSGTQLYCW